MMTCPEVARLPMAKAYKGAGWGWLLPITLLITQLLIPVHANGNLKSLTTTSSSLITGATSVDLTFSFKVNTTLPTDGDIVIGFPSSIYPITDGTWANAFTSLTGSLDGTATVTGTSSTSTVVISRSGLSAVSP